MEKNEKLAVTQLRGADGRQDTLRRIYGQEAFAKLDYESFLETLSESLKLFLPIFSDRILDSRVDRAMPSLLAAPEGPKIRPAHSRKAASIVSFS